MTLEVIEKMLYHFGEYFIQDLLWKRSAFRDLISAIIYNLIHASVLFTLLIIYNVILNSDISLFVILLFVNNSMKLKSIITKISTNKPIFFKPMQILFQELKKFSFLYLLIQSPKKDSLMIYLKNSFLCLFLNMLLNISNILRLPKLIK